MFHNGCYAKINDALRYVAISTGYSRLHAVGARVARLCESAAGQAPQSQGVGVARNSSARSMATPGGKIGRRTERWCSPIAIPSQTLTRIFLFSENLVGISHG